MLHLWTPLLLFNFNFNILFKKKCGDSWYLFFKKFLPSFKVFTFFFFMLLVTQTTRTKSEDCLLFEQPFSLFDTIIVLLRKKNCIPLITSNFSTRKLYLSSFFFFVCLLWVCRQLRNLNPASYWFTYIYIKCQHFFLLLFALI